jgi:hypothetical protein
VRAAVVATMLILAAVATASTEVVRGDFSLVGEVFSHGCTGEPLTVVLGYEHQMTRTHYDRFGNVAWVSEHQTDVIQKAVAADGTEYVMHEVDNNRITEDTITRIGIEFAISGGSGGDFRSVAVFREATDGSYQFENIRTTCT